MVTAAWDGEYEAQSLLAQTASKRIILCHVSKSSTVRAEFTGRATLDNSASVSIFPPGVEYLGNLVEAALGVVALFTVPAFFRALMLYNGRRALAKEGKVVLCQRQLGLLGLKTTGPDGAAMG